MMCQYLPGVLGARDEHSCVLTTINIRVHHRMSEIDVLVIPFQNLESASKRPTASLSTEKGSHVVGIFTKQWSISNLNVHLMRG